MHSNRIFVVSILLQFQFVAPRLVFDFCARVVRGLFGCWGGIGFDLPLFFRLFSFYFFFIFESAFGLVLANIGQQQPNGKNLNCFIAVFGFFLEQTAGLLWPFFGSWQLWSVRALGVGFKCNRFQWPASIIGALSCCWKNLKQFSFK